MAELSSSLASAFGFSNETAAKGKWGRDEFHKPRGPLSGIMAVSEIHPDPLISPLFLNNNPASNRKACSQLPGERT
jgi:hypothetical protein